jgi:hypothetical protein
MLSALTTSRTIPISVNCSLIILFVKVTSMSLYDYVFDWSVQRGAQEGVQGSSSKSGGPRLKVVQEEDEHRASDRM